MTDKYEKEYNLHKYVMGLPQQDLQGKPEKVLEAIDHYSDNVEKLMNIGKEKGDLMIGKLRQRIKPGTVVAELGGYMGYSAIKLAAALPDDGKYYSFELNPEFAKIATDFIKLAGLSNKIEIIIGEAKTTLPQFAEKHKGTVFDGVLIDHWKDQYTPDIRVIETLGLVAPGSVVFADNTVYPGAPDYLEYIRMTPSNKKLFIEANVNRNGSQYPGRSDIQWKNEAFEFTIRYMGKQITDKVEVSEFSSFL